MSVTGDLELLSRDAPAIRLTERFGERLQQSIHGSPTQLQPWRDNIGKQPNLLGWSELGDVMRRRPARWPRDLMSRAGSPLPAHEFLRTNATSTGYKSQTWRDADTMSLLSDGASLILNEFDQESDEARQVAMDLEYASSVSVQANAYISQGTEAGFSTHWDDHDALIIQLEGCKNWKIYKPGPEVPAAGSQPWWQGVMNDGDYLYLPKGWWHHVVSSGAPSLHLTFSIPKIRLADATAGYLRRLNGTHRLDQQLSVLSVLRDELPEVEGCGSVDVGDVLPTAELIRYARIKAAGLCARPSFHFEKATATATRSREPITTRLPTLAFLEQTPDLSKLYALGRTFTFRREAIPLVRLLLSSENTDLREVMRRDKSEARGRTQRFVDELLAEGLVAWTR